MRWDEEEGEVERQIELMTRKRVSEIVFDTEINKWSVKNSEFGQIMKVVYLKM